MLQLEPWENKRWRKRVGGFFFCILNFILFIYGLRCRLNSGVSSLRQKMCRVSAVLMSTGSQMTTFMRLVFFCTWLQETKKKQKIHPSAVHHPVYHFSEITERPERRQPIQRCWILMSTIHHFNKLKLKESRAVLVPRTESTCWSVRSLALSQSKQDLTAIVKWKTAVLVCVCLYKLLTLYGRSASRQRFILFDCRNSVGN